MPATRSSQPETGARPAARARVLIEDVPETYHGPVDFPCYGCAVRSVAEYYGREVSKNSLMFQGSLRYAYPYSYGIGFKALPASWEQQGFALPTDYAAGVAGLEIRYLDLSAKRPFASIWQEWREYLDKGVPVVMAAIGMEIMWHAAGIQSDYVRAAHTTVIVGYDESRQVAIIHDNYWHYDRTGSDDIRYIEVPIAAIEEAFRIRETVPQLERQSYIVTGTREPEQAPLSEIIRAQADMMLGRRIGLKYTVAGTTDEVTVGAPAFAAAARDFESVPDLEALKRLIQSMTKLVLRNNWKGVEGQPVRAAWLSGVSAATRNAKVEEASFYIDIVADAFCRARHEMQGLKAAVEGGATLEGVRDILRRLVSQFERASDAERKAGEALQEAVPQLRAAGY